MSYTKYKNIADPLDGVVYSEITSMGTVLGGQRFTFRLLRDIPAAEGTKITNFFLKDHIESIKRVLDEVLVEIERAEQGSFDAQKRFLEEKRRRSASDK